MRPSRWIVLLLALLSWTPTNGVGAETDPHGALQRAHGRRVMALGASPEGTTALMDLWRGARWAPAASTRQALVEIAESRRVPPHRQVAAKRLLARMRLEGGDVEGARAAITALGYVRDWRVAGPFDNGGREGFDTPMPPEVHLPESWDPAYRMDGKGGPVPWRAYASLGAEALVDFEGRLRPDRDVCAYAETYVLTTQAQALSLWVGAGGAVAVFWNGEEVHRDRGYRRPFPDRVGIPVPARVGTNRLLVKVCTRKGPWNLRVRVADRQGAPLSGLQFVADRYRDLGVAGPVVLGPYHSDREELEAALGSRAPSADAAFRLARYLHRTGSDDLTEPRAFDLARTAARAKPTPEHLLFASRLADDRGERMHLLAEAEARWPKNRDVLLRAAELRVSSIHPADALPLLDRLGTTDAVGDRAIVLRGKVLSAAGLDDAAYETVRRRLSGRAGLGWREHLLRFASRAGRHDDAHRYRIELVQGRATAADARKALIQDALRREERSVAADHLAILLAMDPGSVDLRRYVADIYEGMGDLPQALTTLAEAVALAPDDADVLLAKARVHLRRSQEEVAADLLRRVLVLRPQDTAARDLLRRLRPASERADRYAVEMGALLERRRPGGGDSSTVLQDLTVRRVYDNGLGTQFHQYAVQLHDVDATRENRTFTIPFTPASQRVDVSVARVIREDGAVLDATERFEQQLGEPWYRIYYDTRALGIVFPDLQKGDVIELQYRIDDVARTNMFDDYFGDLHFFQSDAATVERTYVLVTPASRKFYFNRPKLSGLKESTKVEGKERTYRFVARDVPPLAIEEGMPGMTEVAPYLLVSTYRTWEEVGRWWWGLVRDQLQADADLKATVAELTKGAKTTEEKVRRIHAWAMAHTRYVGLEFGIHGFKPYRVTQIVRRGFGDCKDKASLLYTMFREAGVDARIALVRTRRNGHIPDLPASLSVFDHAIAYVPELDLFIDGTAEHNGVRELPAMDQGVTVLVVGPEDVALRKTPVDDPEKNVHRRTIRGDLDKGGRAFLLVEEELGAKDASRYRKEFQAEGTRKGRLERFVRSVFPGLVLEGDPVMEGLDTLGGAVRVQYEARVPSLAEKGAGELRVPPTVLGGLVAQFARPQHRDHPLELGVPSVYEEQRTLRPPGGYRITHLPAGGEESSPFGRVVLHYEDKGGALVSKVRFEIAVARVSPTAYPAFRAWLTRADDLLQDRAVFRLAEDSP
ncbi:MAG: DUF3857 domain-containing protein [Myxococcales bacterium]|nr:DUF3857 domain-containing protein [Myxococcales bacterium]